MFANAVFVGDGSLLIRCAEYFRDSGQIITAVATTDQQISNWADQNSIPVLAKSDFLNGHATDLTFDFLFSISNLDIVPAPILARARRLAVNFHDALLPRYAGLHATSWALVHQESVHGVTWHEMTGSVDKGRILAQQSFDVLATDTALSLNTKCYEAGAASFAAMIQPLVAGTLEPQPQTGDRSYFGRTKRPPAAATLDFRKSAADIAALVRALDFGQYTNPLGRAKVLAGGRLFAIGGAAARSGAAGVAPGTVTHVEDDLVAIAGAAGEVVLTGLSTLDGMPLGSPAAHGFHVGAVLPPVEPATVAAIDTANRKAAAAEPFWMERLSHASGFELPYPRCASNPGDLPAHRIAISLPAGARAPEQPAAAFAAWLARLIGQAALTLSFADPALGQPAYPQPWFAATVPLAIDCDPESPVSTVTDTVAKDIALVREMGPFASDLPLRLPAGEARAAARRWHKAGIAFATPAEPGPALSGREILLVLHCAEGTAELVVCAQAYTGDVAQAMARHLAWFIDAFVADGVRALRQVPLVPTGELAAMARANATAAPFAGDICIHDDIAATVGATPDREAVVCHGHSLTYRALDAKAEALASQLVALGAGPGTIVGLCLERTPDLVVAVLGIHKAGAAYLPLDPDYPRDRIAFMLADAGAPIMVTSRRVQKELSLPCANTVYIEDAEITQALPPAARQPAAPDDLAYVIYTSGSTGQPKGVMVTHRNVMNFFAGMDARIPHATPGVWLAVTSLSFDISVLELCWTLARGFTIVLHSDAPQGGAGTAPEFSLFYFSSDEAADIGDKYRLLLEGAKFADRNGFAAVWTPERHFHAFGGLYPNAAVSSAAIAACTERVGIRGGSCVLPLHHPIRVAEDWSMVDNLSRGRAGVAFAAGWQPNDFIVSPGRFETRKETMLESIETVRRLWRGDRLPFTNPLGKTVEIGTMPRPVQKDLPIWLTAAGNPETFRQAGELGAGVLTHLLGQTLEDVAEKVRQYRVAWHKAGHKGNGHITLMLHTFVGDDENEVRDIVRAPMKHYLGSAMDLVRQAAWTFPTFVQRAAADGRTPADILDAEDLSEADKDGLLEHAFARYYKTSGLFGTPDSCLDIIANLKRIGVDEVACLIDFGIETDLVLRHLDHLKRLMDKADAADEPGYRVSIAEEIVRHGVTHLQCTPSMASMLVADAAGRTALSRVGTLMVGGEALPLALAGQLRALLPGTFLNMYGPTETTIWSSTSLIDTIGDFVPLGQPIANTTFHVRDAQGQECPAYVAGELHIGGAGVTRDYLNREALTAERFIPDRPGSAGRLYRTGDLVRRTADGAFEFLGRIDHQVKIRGHRIELGEIEAVLGKQPGVQAGVVIAREDIEGDRRLVGYVTARAGASIDTDALRKALASDLPDIMVPSAIVVMPAMPLTPNGKIDRRALPAPRGAAAQATAAPTSEIEKTIAAIWCDLLGLPNVGTSDNFFDLGGHSLLVVQVQRRLREATRKEVAITDMFRFSTIRELAAHLGGERTGASAVDRGVDRAKARQALQQRRQAGLARAGAN